MADEKASGTLEGARSKILEAITVAADRMVSMSDEAMHSGGTRGIDSGKVLDLAQAWAAVNALPVAPPRRGTVTATTPRRPR